MREATIARSLVTDFLGYLGRRGIDADTALRAADIREASVDETHSRVPAAAMERLWAAAERLTGDPDLGLHSAEHYNPGALSIVGYVILSCANAGEALGRLARYAPLLNDGLQVAIECGANTTTCRFGAAPHIESFLHRSPRQAIETIAAGIVLTLARLSRQPPAPLRVNFRHAAPPSRAEHGRLLGPAVHFGQAENSVVYATPALEAGMLSADPALLEVFEGDAQRRLAQLEARATVGERVRVVVAARLKGDVPSLASIASELAMSERSVQRSLGAEATSYRDIVDDVRKGIALARLAQPGARAADVALLLGFSEPSAFSRAFRRWTGAAPSHFRQA